MLGPVLATAPGLLDANKALAPFADPIIALFFGGLVLAAALRAHGLDLVYIVVLALMFAW